MPRYRSLLLAALLVLLCGQLSRAQSSSSIRGTVYRNHHEMQGLKVRLSNPSIAFERTVITDSQGGYNFENVRPADGYILTVIGGDGRIAAVDIINASLQHNPWLPHPAIELTRRFNLIGTLSDGQNPVPNQRVTLTNTILGMLRTGATDKSGRYEFDGLAFGNDIEKAYILQSRNLKPTHPVTTTLTTQAPVRVDLQLGTPLSRPPVQLARNTAPTSPAPSAPARTQKYPPIPVATPQTASSTTPMASPTTPTPSPAPSTAEAIQTPPQTPPGSPTSVAAAGDEPGTKASDAHMSAANAVNPPAPSPALPSTSTASISAPDTKLLAVVAQNDFEPSMEAGISSEQLRVLPLFNRNFLALGQLVAGVHDVNAGSPLEGAAFSISGSRTTSTNFLIDGQDNVASSSNQAIPFQVNEAIQEFRVIYANPSAAYGQSSGGVVDVVTSRGASATRAFHGALFGYFNNDALNANTPLSAYSTTGFAKAAAYGGSLGDTCTGNCIINATQANGSPVYNSFAPTTYNMLYNIIGTLPGGSGTALLQAGAFDGQGALSQTDSHVQPFSSQQFGGKLGGSLTSKLFLFGSYEGTRIDNSNPIYERVPSLADIQGAGAGKSADYQTAQGVLGLFPAANVAHTGYAGSGTSAPTGTFAFYKGVAPNYTRVHNLLVRPDFSLDPANSFSLRYTGQILDQLHDDSLPVNSPSGYPGNGAERKAQNQSLALVHTYTFPSGRAINVARLGFTQFRLDELAQDRNFDFTAHNIPRYTYVLSGVDNQLAGATAAKAGLVGGWYDAFWNTCATVSGPGCTAAESFHSPSPITPSLDGDFPFARIGAPLTAPSANRDTEGEGSDLISFQAGSRHHLNAGAIYRYQQNLDYEAGLARGIVVSNNIGEFTTDSETCISCGEAFVKPSFDYSLRQPAPYLGDLRSSSVEGFLEDRFQPSANLSITAGVRYEYFGQPLDTNNRLWNYSPAAGGLVRQGATGTYDPFDYACGEPTTRLDSIYSANSISFSSSTAGQPNPWNCKAAGTFSLPDNKHDIAPRLGIAYAPDSNYRDVLRAAVGLYFDHLPAEYNEQLLANRPTPLSPSSPNAIYGQNFYSAACNAVRAAPGNSQQNEQCGLGNSTLNGAASSEYQAQYQAASSAGSMLERDTQHLGDPYTLQFSTSYQHLLGNNWTGEAAYIGSISRHLPLIYDSNYTNEFYCTLDGSVNPNGGGLCDNNTFFPVFTEGNIGTSSYHSLVIRVHGEAWRGLTLHASYTMGKSLDDIAGSQFPRATDSLWNQLFGRQLFGSGNPVAFALGANSVNPGGGGGRGSSIAAPCSAGSRTCLRSALFNSATIPSFDAISEALTTTGSRQIVASNYSLPQNPIGFAKDDYGRSDFDVNHRAVVDLVYKLPPLGRSQWTRQITASAIFVGQSGQPFSIFSGPAFGQVTQRVNLVSSLHSSGKPGQYFSNAGGALQLPGTSAAAVNSNCLIYAYAPLYTGTQGGGACTGTSGRNAFTGPAYFSQDVALQKAIRGFRDEHSIVVRVEIFNLLDRANYYNPISEYSTDGVHVNPEFGIIRSAHDPRQIQFAIRYDF